MTCWVDAAAECSSQSGETILDPPRDRCPAKGWALPPDGSSFLQLSPHL